MKKDKKIYSRDFISLQSIGLFPVLLIMLLNNFISEVQVVRLSMVFGVLGLLVLMYRWSVHRIHDYMGLVGMLSLFLFAVIKILFYDVMFMVSNTVSICVLLIINLIIVRDLRSLFLSFILRKKLLLQTMKHTTYEFYYMSGILLYILSFYVALLIVFNSDGRELYPKTYAFLNYYLDLILLGAFFLYEYVRMRMLNTCFKNEIWLPVIDSKMRVSGCIERNQSISAGDTFMHPHVRIIVMYNENFYLCQTKSTDGLLDGGVDTPFSEDIFYEETSENCIRRLTDERIKGKFTRHKLITTVYHTQKIRRLVMLYVIYLDDEKEIATSNTTEGRFWSVGQIEQNLGQNIFSPCFEQEFEFIKNTILLAMRYKNRGSVAK